MLGEKQTNCSATEWREMRRRTEKDERKRIRLSGGKEDFPGKESACNAGDQGLIPGSGRSPREGNAHLLQHSCLENLMDRGAWQRIRDDGMTFSFTVGLDTKNAEYPVSIVCIWIPWKAVPFVSGEGLKDVRERRWFSHLSAVKQHRTV